MRSLLLLAVALALPLPAVAAEAVCPTAPPGEPSLFFWHTTRQLEHMVWSSDNQQIGAVEYVFEEKRSWNPLDGTTLKRKHCHQLSILDAQGKLVRYVGPMQPNQAGDITFMQPGGYFTVQSYVRDFGGWDFHRVALDGTRTLLGHVEVGCQYGAILPSPDGKQIAFFEIAGHCDNDGRFGNDVVVSFFDGATSQKLGVSPSVPLPGGAWETWTPAGALILTDLQKSVRVSFDGGGQVQLSDAPVPRCTSPGTTSSLVAADGRTLGFDSHGKVVIVGSDAAAAFGCQ
jgi:hypothetical protein